MRNRQEPVAAEGDWIYGMDPKGTAHFVTKVHWLMFSSIPHAETACGKDYQIGSTTMSTFKVRADIPSPTCEVCGKEDNE